jgi:hypothetical protein
MRDDDLSAESKIYRPKNRQVSSTSRFETEGRRQAAERSRAVSPIPFHFRIMAASRYPHRADLN